jgi:hypothetical protein
MKPLPGTSNRVPLAIAVCPNEDLMVLAGLPGSASFEEIWKQSSDGGDLPVGPAQGGFTYVGEVPGGTFDISCSGYYNGTKWVDRLWTLVYESRGSQLLQYYEPLGSTLTVPQTIGTPGNAAGMFAFYDSALFPSQPDEMWVLNNDQTFWFGSGVNGLWTLQPHGPTGVDPLTLTGEMSNSWMFVVNPTAGLWWADVFSPTSWTHVASFVRNTTTASDALPDQAIALAAFPSEVGVDYLYMLTQNGSQRTLYAGAFVP